jgi:hypothetical protein
MPSAPSFAPLFHASGCARPITAADDTTAEVYAEVHVKVYWLFGSGNRSEAYARPQLRIKLTVTAYVAAPLSVAVNETKVLGEH